MGLIGALMAIPIAAGIKVLLSERLQAATRPTPAPQRPATARRPRNPARPVLIRCRHRTRHLP